MTLRDQPLQPAVLGGEWPSRAALQYFHTGLVNWGRNAHLNNLPLLSDLVSELNQPWYGAIVGLPGKGCQEESGSAQGVW